MLLPYMGLLLWLQRLHVHKLPQKALSFIGSQEVAVSTSAGSIVSLRQECYHYLFPSSCSGSLKSSSNTLRIT